MKKLFFVLLSMLILTGCNSKLPENSESTAETTTTTSTVISTTTAETVTEAVTEEQTEPTTEKIKKTLINNSQNEYPKFTELNLEPPNETDLMNRRKIIFPTDDGYYYYVYIGGRDSANYTLGFDSGDGNAVPFMECEDCVWYFMDGDTIYGTQSKLHDNGKMNICKYENGIVTPIIKLPSYSQVFFDSEYIYYVKYRGDSSEFYRADYNGENIEYIFTADDNYIEGFTVYNDRIYYDDLRIYDMNSGELIEISSGRFGRINGGYMYYLAYNNLMRMNIENYVTELVCEDVSGFEFCGDTIFCSSAFGGEDSGTLFKLENGEKQKIFDADEFFGTDYYYEIWGIQYESGRIFIEISSGPYYSYIAEIDSYGNFIRKYYEDNSW